MTFHFQSLKNLAKHHYFLSKKFQNSDFFLVGGSVRDLLLGLTKAPIDIDITLAGNPLEIYDSIDKEGLSHFITEKF